MKQVQSIGVVGLGKMGLTMAKTIAKGNRKVFGFDPYPPKDLPNSITLLDNLSKLVDGVDCIVIAVKPNLVEEVVRSIKSPKLILCIAAGVTTSQLKNWAVKDSRLIRVMPNLPMVSGRGALGYTCDFDLKDIASELFSGMGQAVFISKESLMDAVTGLSGSGPAYVLTFLQAMAEAGLKEGLNFEESLLLSMETIEGTICYFRDLKEADPAIHPMEVRNWVTSPGGTTIHGLDALERGGFSTSVRDAVRAAAERSRELREG
ncbi:MAG: pyrroline-5-carboxylate reductase [Leptospira sp.]|nr:pyrroline-5-carboxylate reductase [Leptospira sp.]